MRAVGDQTRPPLEKDEEKSKDSVSFRFPSPLHHLSFFAPSAKSPRIRLIRGWMEVLWLGYDPDGGARTWEMNCPV